MEHLVATNQRQLYTMDTSASTDGITECQDLDNESCVKINVNFDVLMVESDTLLEGEVFRHSYTSQNNDHSKTYAYESDDLGSALFLYTEMNGYPEIDGYFLTHGSEYRINNCGEQCGNGHILLKLSEKMVHPHPDEEIEVPEEKDALNRRGPMSQNMSMPFPEYILMPEDRDSATTISVMSYYTPKFKQEFANPEQEIKTYIEATNQAFKNSGIGSVKLKYFDCSFEEIDIMDRPNDISRNRLLAFTQAKGHVAFLLKTHDIAMLMTKNKVIITRPITSGTFVGLT